MSLRVENLSLTIGAKPILSAVSLSARPGEVTVIVGPNGSGKTSLLKTVTGELRGTGHIALNTTPVTAATAQGLARERGVLAQSTQVAFDFNVAEIVRMGLQAGVHGDHPDILDQALDTVGMLDFAEHPYRVLSGGEQQRVHLARVLAQVWSPVVDDKPCWLFLDEPVASLDIGHQLEIVELAQDYARRGGGVVAVMHDLNLTAMMADHVAIMQNGSILASGRVEDVLQDDILSAAYGCHLRVGQTPPGGASLYILPQTAVRLGT